MTDKTAGVFHALIVMGVSSSGKSTIGAELAKRLNWVFEDGDDFHSDSNIEKMREGHPLTDEDRWPWLCAIAAEIHRRRKRSESVVIACSALKRSYRDILIDGHADVRIVYLRGNRELLRRRITTRQHHFTNPDLLDSQLATLEEPSPDEHVIAVDTEGPIDSTVDNILDQFRGGGPAL